MSDELVQRVEEYANKMGISRSASISVLCSQALQTEQGINVMEQVMQLWQQQQAIQIDNDCESGL